MTKPAPVPFTEEPLTPEEQALLEEEQNAVSASALAQWTEPVGIRELETTPAPAEPEPKPYALRPRSKHSTEQTVGTPWEFIDAVESRFEPIEFDLAADVATCKARWGTSQRPFFDETNDALAQDWNAIQRGALWLNPPLKNIEPWAAKCALARHRQGFLYFLVPASVGTSWFVRHVRDHAMVLALEGRLTFQGHDKPYPKDLMLCIFGYGLRGFDTWGWR